MVDTKRAMIGIGEASPFQIYITLSCSCPAVVRARGVLNASATEVKEDGAIDRVVELLGTLNEDKWLVLHP